MRFRKDYTQNPDLVKEIGGEILAQLKDQAAETPAKACPFCGGEAVVEVGFIYGTLPTVRVMCSDCHIGTATAAAGFNFFTGEYTTIAEDLAEAAAKWNRRQG